MTEIKEKVSRVSGGVEITSSSDAFIQGDLEQLRRGYSGTNGVVVDSGVISATRNTASLALSFNAQSPSTNEAPVSSRLTIVSSFEDNPSGLGHFLRSTRVRAMKRHQVHDQKAA